MHLPKMRKNWRLSSGSARPFGDRGWLLPFLTTLLVTATLLLGDGARSVEAAIRDRLPGMATYRQMWGAPRQLASDGRGDLPMEREKGEDEGKKKTGVFWSINFMKHVERVSSGMF